MKKNRKVSRPVPPQPAVPRNVRVEKRRDDAWERFAFWLAAALIMAVEGAVFICLDRVAPGIAFERGEGVILGAMFATGCPVAMTFTLTAWSDYHDAVSRLKRREEVIAARLERAHAIA